jgi:hypothetical protein
VGRACTICSHKRRPAIDAALVSGESNRRIATQFQLGEAAVRRHKAEHLPLQLIQAREAQEVADADSLLAHLRSLNRETLSIPDQAKQSGDLRIALMAIGQARGNLELLAKLAGELQQEGTVNLVISPEYLQVRTRLIAALAPYPDARLAVVAALQLSEAESG